MMLLTAGLCLRKCHVVQDVDRFSPAWWFADVPDTAIIPLRKLEAIVPYLRQVVVVLEAIVICCPVRIAY